MRWPYEVLELIATHAANTPDELSAPSALVSIFLLSRSVHDTLLGAPERGLPANNALLARIYESRFDKAAPERRIGTLTSHIRAEELKKRCRAMKRIQSGQYYADHALEDLWLVYLMLLEDDGNNMRQLEHAGVEQWIKNLLVSSAEQQLDEDGWPVESEMVQLAAAIVSIVCDRACITRESMQARGELLVSLHPFLVAAHRYPVAHFPDTQCYISSQRRLRSSRNNTLATLTSTTVYAPATITHCGHRLTLSPPPVADGAICAIVMRNERQDSWYRRDIPQTREEADALQPRWKWATQADWQESNLLRAQGLGVEIPRVGSENSNLAMLENPKVGSERWDVDFWRMVYPHRALDADPDTDRHLTQSWFGTVYQPGMFTGKWVGRYLMHDWRGFTRMLAMHPAPLADVAATLLDEELGQYFQPMQFNLREHITTDGLQHVASGEAEVGDGIQNGWFPPQLDLSKGWGMREAGNELVVRDPREPEEAWAVKRYKTWYPGMELPTPKPPPAFPLASSSSASSPVEAAPAEDEAEVPAEVPADVEMDFANEFDAIPMEVGRVVGPHPEARGMDLVEYDPLDEDEQEHMEEPDIDVIITGETDYNHGKAWGAFTLYGRVRKNDGLVVLVRAPQDPDPDSGLGRWIFRGYFRAGNAMVGRWRETGTDINAAPYEGAFVLCKVGEAWGLPVPNVA